MKKAFTLLALIVLLASVNNFNQCRGNSSDTPLKNLRTAETDKPNVVLILIDDLSYFGVSAYGARKISSNQNHFNDVPYSTPRIDDLANDGVLFEQAYAYPLCESTRVSLMSGMHGGRNYVATKALHESQITFSDVFQKAGYVTGMYGKWKQSRGTKSVPGLRYISQFGWDDYACFDVQSPKQRYINPDMVVNDVRVSYNNRTDNDPRTGRRWYGPDIFNYKALDFIEAHKDEPFFLYYPMVLIHDDHKPTPDTEPKSAFDDCDESNSNDLRQYIPDMLEYMDKLIGQVVDKIDELGIRDKTMIIVVGDNGCKEVIRFTMADGTNLSGGKGHTRFHGEQVPLIVSWPGTISDSISYAGITDITDIYPSMFDACGIEMPNADKIDGLSFFPQITKANPVPHRKAIYKWYNRNNTIDNESIKVKYAQTADFKFYGPHEIYDKGQFFDLRTDPYEKAGIRGTEISWENYFYSGLDLESLTAEQEEAYLFLKSVVDSLAYVKPDKLELTGGTDTLLLGENLELSCTVSPANTTLNNILYVSSNKKVAIVDKFGKLSTKGSGNTTITVYSWDDALPVANNKSPEYKTAGISDEFELFVKDTVSAPTVGFLNRKTEGLIIYPNPVNNEFFIENIPNARRVQIFNSAGVNKLDKPLGNDQTIVNVEYLPEGLYILVVTNENLSTFSQKILVQNVN